MVPLIGLSLADRASGIKTPCSITGTAAMVRSSPLRRDDSYGTYVSGIRQVSSGPLRLEDRAVDRHPGLFELGPSDRQPVLVDVGPLLERVERLQAVLF